MTRKSSRTFQKVEGEISGVFSVSKKYICKRRNQEVEGGGDIFAKGFGGVHYLGES